MRILRESKIKRTDSQQRVWVAQERWEAILEGFENREPPSIRNLTYTIMDDPAERAVIQPNCRKPKTSLFGSLLSVSCVVSNPSKPAAKGRNKTFDTSTFLKAKRLSLAS
jgi:hypothetical protein